jgi:hypothetical protein
MANQAWRRIQEAGLDRRTPADFLGVSRGGTLTSLTVREAYECGQTIRKFLRANSPTEEDRGFWNLTVDSVQEVRKDRTYKGRGSYQALAWEATKSLMRTLWNDPFLRMPRSLTQGYDSQITERLLTDYIRGINPEQFDSGFHIHVVTATRDRIGPVKSAANTIERIKERFSTESVTSNRTLKEDIMVTRTDLVGVPFSHHVVTGDHSMPEQVGAEIWGGYVKELLEEAA